MFNKIYEKKEFIVFQVKKGYVVYNTRKSFEEGHTHLKHFEAAKTAIDLAINKKIPRSKDGYYIDKLSELLYVREQKGKKEKYCNSGYQM